MGPGSQGNGKQICSDSHVLLYEKYQQKQLKEFLKKQFLEPLLPAMKWCIWRIFHLIFSFLFYGRQYTLMYFPDMFLQNLQNVIFWTATRCNYTKNLLKNAKVAVVMYSLIRVSSVVTSVDTIQHDASVVQC